MMTIPSDPLLYYCKLLLDEERLQILGALFTAPKTVSQLAQKLTLRPRAVINHLDLLTKAQIVKPPTKSDAPYSIDLAALLAAKKQLFASEKAHKLAQLPEDMNLEQREQLLPYFDKTTLTEIPFKEKPLLALLAWLAEKFSPGQTYPEKQVNEILKVVHSDTASLRRLLVDYGFLARANNQYWRLQRD
jgi:DNA-binding transcriptional ArsR family regulator